MMNKTYFDLDAIEAMLNEQGLFISSIMPSRIQKIGGVRGELGYQVSVKSRTDPAFFRAELGDTHTETLTAVIVNYASTPAIVALALALRDNLEARLEVARGEND